MFERYYPSSESILANVVNAEDLFNYIFHGFAKMEVNGKVCYVSYNFEKPLLLIESNSISDAVMVSINSGQNVTSDLIRIATRLKQIQVHFNDTPVAWQKVDDFLSNKENANAISNYQVTIESLISRMFPTKH